MKWIPISIALCAASLAHAAEASGQSWRSVVREQLSTAASTFQEAGLRQSSGVFSGSEVFGYLDDDATSYMELSLEGGREYLIVGVCDQDCSDLDLRVFDGSFDVVEKDVEVDDVPIVVFTAQQTGAYALAVDMPGCSEDPCYYGVRVYSR